MKHYKFGYARVSTEQQNLDRQLDMLKAYSVDHTYNEKMTGTKKDRPELTKLLDRMEAGDTVVIESLSRLGRSTKDLIALVELFEQRGVKPVLIFLQAAVAGLRIAKLALDDAKCVLYLAPDRGFAVLNQAIPVYGVIENSG